MTIDAGWYPVALASGLEPGTSTGTRLFGQEIVVWRDGAGLSHVWEDRCPHRGMRLSFGFVRGDHIACLYHGWRFDGAGQCRFIPAHPKLEVPDTIKVTRYASAEQAGLVWAHLGGAEASRPPPGGNVATTPVRSISVRASETMLCAALETMASPWDADEPIVIDRAGPMIWLRASGENLGLALQPLSEGEVCVHIALGGNEPDDRLSHRPVVSRWAEILRRLAEAKTASAARVR